MYQNWNDSALHLLIITTTLCQQLFTGEKLELQVLGDNFRNQAYSVSFSTFAMLADPLIKAIVRCKTSVMNLRNSQFTHFLSLLRRDSKGLRPAAKELSLGLQQQQRQQGAWEPGEEAETWAGIRLVLTGSRSGVYHSSGLQAGLRLTLGPGERTVQRGHQWDYSSRTELWLERSTGQNLICPLTKDGVIPEGASYILGLRLPLFPTIGRSILRRIKELLYWSSVLTA